MELPAMSRSVQAKIACPVSSGGTVKDDTIEIQMFDGTIDEVDAEAWRELLLVEIAAPEDWSGSVDMDPDDYKGTATNERPTGFHDPLEFLDKE